MQKFEKLSPRLQYSHSPISGYSHQNIPKYQIPNEDASSRHHNKFGRNRTLLTDFAEKR